MVGAFSEAFIQIFNCNKSRYNYARAATHDDVIKWQHFPRYWLFGLGIHRWPVISPHKGQWRGALMFSLIYARINSWVNNGETCDLRRHRAHYDVIAMGRGINGIRMMKYGILQINRSDPYCAMFYVDNRKSYDNNIQIFVWWCSEILHVLGTVGLTILICKDVRHGCIYEKRKIEYNIFRLIMIFPTLFR